MNFITYSQSWLDIKKGSCLLSEEENLNNVHSIAEEYIKSVLGSNKFAIIDGDKVLSDNGNILKSLSESQKSLLQKIDSNSNTDLIILGKGIYTQKIGSTAIYNSGGDEVASVNIIETSSSSSDDSSTYDGTVQLYIGDSNSTTLSYTNVATIKLTETYSYSTYSTTSSYPTYSTTSSFDGTPIETYGPTKTYITLNLIVTPLTNTIIPSGVYTCTIPVMYNYKETFTANNGIVYTIDNGNLSITVPDGLVEIESGNYTSKTFTAPFHQ